MRATLLLHLAVFCLVYGQIRPGTITGSVNDGTGSAVTTAAVSIVNQETSISGDVAWRNPLGSFDELDALGVPTTGTPEPRGGPIATGGGVLFIGATIDARFRALDARTGKELWTTKLVDAAKATPITYQGKNGKQYVAILAGGGETRGPENPGGRLYVFALP